MGVLSFIGMLLLLMAACGKDGPCAGGGMAVDSRELPADWAELAPPPDGAVGCHAEDGSMDSEYGRQYELGGSPQEGFDLWRAHLAELGWTAGEDTTTERGFEQTFARDGASLQVYVSRAENVSDKGWCSLNFHPAGSAP